MLLGYLILLVVMSLLIRAIMRGNQAPSNSKPQASDPEPFKEELVCCPAKDITNPYSPVYCVTADPGHACYVGLNIHDVPKEFDGKEIFSLEPPPSDQDNT